MKKKVVALVLGMAMAVSALAGCGSTDTVKESSQAESTERTEESSAAESTQENSQEAAESEEIALDAFAGTTLTIAVKKNTADMTKDWNEKPAFKMAEEATGIHIEFIELEEAIMSERINIMLASGDDMPDAFWGCLGSGTIAGNKELFYDLSEEGLLETYAPNVVADYATLDGGKGIERVTWPDGSIYSLMSNQASNIKDCAQSGVLLINKGWLDKLGLEVPKTAEEFMEAMIAFRDNDMDGDGDATNEIPFEFCENNWCGHIMSLADCWGIAGQGSSDSDRWKKLEDGKVYPTLDTDAYRDFLEFVHQMIEEKLIDVEGFSQTNEQYKAKLATGTVGCFPGYTALHVMGYEYAKDFVPILFQGVEGVEPIASGVQETNSAYNTTFVPTAKCENIEALLHWWNYLSSSTEMKWTVNLGEKGGCWDIDENGQVIDKVPKGLTDTFTVMNYNYTYGISAGMFPLLREDEVSSTISDDPQSTSYWRYNICMEMRPYMTDEYWPRRFVDEAATEEKNFITVDMSPVITSYTSTSMMEGVTDASWEQFLDDLEAYGYYEYIDWYQRWVDGEF